MYGRSWNEVLSRMTLLGSKVANKAQCTWQLTPPLSTTAMRPLTIPAFRKGWLASGGTVRTISASSDVYSKRGGGCWTKQRWLE